MERDPLDIENTISRDESRGAYALAAGAMLGQYRIVRPLGRGGMGEVYEVEHGTLERSYALKLLPAGFANQPGALERFRREARVMANLEHPNIIRVDDFGETEGRYWLRMELAGGQYSGVRSQDSEGNSPKPVVSLQDLADVRGGRIPQEELFGILMQILEGLAYAHGHGAIHRDLKPSNILFSTGVVKIADFGLVRLVGEEWVLSQADEAVRQSMTIDGQRTRRVESAGTSTQSMLGTYEYMSPEQKRGEEATERSDLYAVGLMAFRLLTGQIPGLKTPSRIDRNLVGGWDDFLEKALEEKTQDRWPSAESMRSRLDVCGRMQTALRDGSGQGAPANMENTPDNAPEIDRTSTPREETDGKALRPPKIIRRILGVAFVLSVVLMILISAIREFYRFFHAGVWLFALLGGPALGFVVGHLQRGGRSNWMDICLCFCWAAALIGGIGFGTDPEDFPSEWFMNQFGYAALAAGFFSAVSFALINFRKKNARISKKFAEHSKSSVCGEPRR